MVELAPPHHTSTTGVTDADGNRLYSLMHAYALAQRTRPASCGGVSIFTLTQHNASHNRNKCLQRSLHKIALVESVVTVFHFSVKPRQRVFAVMHWPYPCNAPRVLRYWIQEHGWISFKQQQLLLGLHCQTTGICLLACCPSKQGNIVLHRRNPRYEFSQSQIWN